MATAKKTTVTLQTKDGAISRDFDVAHAERVLRLSNSAWTLPENSIFVFENGSISRNSAKGNKRRVEQSNG